jgi:transposase
MTPVPAAADTLAHLPDDPVVLKRMLAELLDALRQERHDKEALQHRLDQLLRRLYGPRAEHSDPDQPLLFATPAAESSLAVATPTEPVPTMDADAAATKRRGHGRQRLPEHLVREPRVYELSEAERRCPCCGEVREALGQQTCEQLEYVPASLRVIEHVKTTYACPRCERTRRAAAGAADASDTQLSTVETAATPASEVTTATAAPPAPRALTPTESLAVLNAASGVTKSSTFITAPRPLTGVPRCLAAPGLLAYVIISKFVEHLPLYRLERQFTRQGVPVSRQTMCDWLARSADLLTPLCQLMIQHVLQSRLIQTDDTPVPVQDDTRDRTRTGRVWLYHGDVEHDYLVYQYSPTREQHWPQTFLQGYTGFVQADAYAGYDALFATGRMREVACWAHARRKFFEAQQTDPERALYVLGVIRQLYAVEKRARQEKERLGLPWADYWALRLRQRQEQCVSILTTLCHWLKEQQRQVLPKSPIGEAITYALNQWDALVRYTTEGFLEIDNNAVERALRPIAVGRKNYLFFGSDVGGQTAAVLYTFTQTCQHLGVEPWRYLRDALERLPMHPVERLEEWLPDRWAEAQRSATAASLSSAQPDSG